MKLADAREQFSKARRPPAPAPAPVELCASCIDEPVCLRAHKSQTRSPIVDCLAHRPKPGRGLCETCAVEFSCEKAHPDFACEHGPASGRVEFCDKHRSDATPVEPGA